jgi:hypothetical protein
MRLHGSRRNRCRGDRPGAGTRRGRPSRPCRIRDRRRHPGLDRAATRLTLPQSDSSYGVGHGRRKLRGFQDVAAARPPSLRQDEGGQGSRPRRLPPMSACGSCCARSWASTRARRSRTPTPSSSPSSHQGLANLAATFNPCCGKVGGPCFRHRRSPHRQEDDVGTIDKEQIAELRGGVRR